MAKLTKNKLVSCDQCAFSIGEVVNFLVGCKHEKVNPNNAKMGTYPRVCQYFKPKK